MSSTQKIGRWKRFEIAFAQETCAEESLFRTPERSAPDKTRGLRKTNKMPSSERSPVENGTPEKEASPENALSRSIRFPVAGTPSHWEEARRQKQDAAKKTTKKRKKRR